MRNTPLATLGLSLALLLCVLLSSQACDGDERTPAAAGTPSTPTAVRTVTPTTATPATPSPAAETATAAPETPMPPPATPTPAATSPVRTRTPKPPDARRSAAPTYPPGTTTGIPEVDAVVGAITAGDAGPLLDLVRYTEVPCAVMPSGGFPQPPQCPQGVPDGTPIEALGGMHCEGFWLRRDEVPAALESFVAGGHGLYAVYRLPAPAEPSDWPAGEYLVVFAGRLGAEREPPTYAVTVTIGRGGLVAYGGTCDQSPEQFVANVELEPLLPPPE